MNKKKVHWAKFLNRHSSKSIFSPWENHFGKRTALSLIYFLNYAYLKIWPSVLFFSSPSIYLGKSWWIIIKIWTFFILLLNCRAKKTRQMPLPNPKLSKWWDMIWKKIDFSKTRIFITQKENIVSSWHIFWLLKMQIVSATVKNAFNVKK